MRKALIVVCGEALVDVFPAGDTATGMSLDARIGGSPLNVAMGLARLGQAAAFFGGVSTGAVGERLLRALIEEGVDTVPTVRVAAPATLSLVGVDARGVPDYAFYGHGAADRQVTRADLAGVPEAATAYQFGSYAMVVQPVGHAQRALVERECGRSVIAYDPNVRLNVEPDLDVWRETLAWMAARTHLLKVSDEDLHQLFPGVPAAELARQWLAAGVRLVVVTRGGEGAWAWTAQHHVAVPPVAVPVLDTVGAGDTFQAALLTALAEREVLSAEGLAALDEATLRAVLGFAAQAAAITCSRRGADLPRRGELPGG